MRVLGLTFLHNTKPSSFGGTKKLYLTRFWRVNMNFSNLIYVAKIFLKLNKIIILIYHSKKKTYSFKFFKRFLSFSSYFTPLKAFHFLSLKILKQSLSISFFHKVLNFVNDNNLTYLNAYNVEVKCQ